MNDPNSRAPVTCKWTRPSGEVNAGIKVLRKLRDDPGDLE